jgi:hypothetical protein
MKELSFMNRKFCEINLSVLLLELSVITVNNLRILPFATTTSHVTGRHIELEWLTLYLANKLLIL